MASPLPTPDFCPNTHFRLHIPVPLSSDANAPRTIDHVVLTVDTLRAQLTMHLPVGHQKHRLPRAAWDRWIVRLHTSFLKKFDTSPSDRQILLTIAWLYRAFTNGQRGAISINSDFYIAFTHGFVELAQSAMGRCVKCDLALYVIDMSVLVPTISTSMIEADRFQAHLNANTDPITLDISDDEAEPDVTMTAPPSPSISAASELPEATGHDSGYESFDSMPTLRTVSDSSDEYESDSSEDPESDEEEEALIRQGFVVDESKSDVSDLDL